jgi:hypothetical protein
MWASCGAWEWGATGHDPRIIFSSATNLAAFPQTVGASIIYPHAHFYMRAVAAFPSFCCSKHFIWVFSSRESRHIATTTTGSA